MNIQFANRLFLAFAFLVLFFSGLACSAASTQQPTPAPLASPSLPPSPIAVASPIPSATMEQSPLPATPNTAELTLPTVAPTEIRTVPAKPTKTADQIAQGWSTTRYLDYAHLSRGMTCETCHQTATPTARPPMQVCIDCHPDTVPAIGAKRRGSTPHNAHLGFLNCFQCHHSHEPFELYCNRCHAIMQTSRFQ